MIPSMLVTNVWDQMCSWQVWDVGDKFEMLVTDLIHLEITNIMKKPPTSQISHHHKVTNITMSPTTLSPFMLMLNGSDIASYQKVKIYHQKIVTNIACCLLSWKPTLLSQFWCPNQNKGPDTFLSVTNVRISVVVVYAVDREF